MGVCGQNFDPKMIRVAEMNAIADFLQNHQVKAAAQNHQLIH